MAWPLPVGTALLFCVQQPGRHECFNLPVYRFPGKAGVFRDERLRWPAATVIIGMVGELDEHQLGGRRGTFLLKSPKHGAQAHGAYSAAITGRPAKHAPMPAHGSHCSRIGAGSTTPPPIMYAPLSTRLRLLCFLLFNAARLSSRSSSVA